MVEYTARQLKTQSDELYDIFKELAVSESRDLTSISQRSKDLMNIFEEDVEEYSSQVERNVENLQEF